MYLYTHLPILEGPDGVPILRVTVLDNRLSEMLLNCERTDWMIYHNAMKLNPSSKHTHTLPAIYNDPSRSPWFSSFISPLYTEHLGPTYQWNAWWEYFQSMQKAPVETRTGPWAVRVAPPAAPAKAQAAKSTGVQTAQPAGRQVAQEANKTAARPGSGAPALAAVSEPCDTRPVSAAATAAAGGTHSSCHSQCGAYSAQGLRPLPEGRGGGGAWPAVLCAVPGGRILLSSLPEGSLAAAQATLHTSWTTSAVNMTDYTWQPGTSGAGG
ncbi:hypothetical protein HaLaN_15060 [Haematococcus lacustris]|uniref:Uncharacterized protein n=1 Tax=Haematococcus lacustris TaxID=44745 RepID=A0A699ZGU0_HAELA|nr:hypothetical protein HaLaN_15060 [Haematococcus lacustris]